MLYCPVEGVQKTMAMKYTEEQLNSIDKSILVQLFLALQEETEKQTRKLEELDEKRLTIDCRPNDEIGNYETYCNNFWVPAFSASIV